MDKSSLLLGLRPSSGPPLTMEQMEEMPRPAYVVAMPGNRVFRLGVQDPPGLQPVRVLLDTGEWWPVGYGDLRHVLRRSLFFLPRLPRLSCRLTIRQVEARTKTCTRRLGPLAWAKPGKLALITDRDSRVPGLRALAVVLITDRYTQRLGDVSRGQVAAEGFPDLRVKQFVEMFFESQGVTPERQVLVLEWEYL